MLVLSYMDGNLKIFSLWHGMFFSWRVLWLWLVTKNDVAITRLTISSLYLSLSDLLGISRRIFFAYLYKMTYFRIFIQNGIFSHIYTKWHIFVYLYKMAYFRIFIQNGTFSHIYTKSHIFTYLYKMAYFCIFCHFLSTFGQF